MQIRALIKNKQTRNKNSSLLHLSCLSITSSLVLVALRAALYQAIYTFVNTTLHANILCNVLLGSFKASGFWYTMNTGHSLKLLFSILHLA